MKSTIIEAMMADPKSTHMSKASAEAALATVARAIKTACRVEKKARVPDLGTFQLKHRSARTVRNPRSGEAVEAAARDVITFKMARGAL